MQIQKGISHGVPVFIGYFPAAMAYGLIAREAGLSLPETLGFSMIMFAGAAQFFAVNLLASGATTMEIIIGVFLVNLRHLLMSASLSQRISSRSALSRFAIGFGNTDEVFATSSSESPPLRTPYLIALEVTSWSGWVLGSLTGFLTGQILPASVQQCMGITLYGMFAALLAGELRRNRSLFMIPVIAAGVDSFLVLIVRMQTGWAFALAMIIASGVGAALLDDETVQGGGSGATIPIEELT